MSKAVGVVLGEGVIVGLLLIVFIYVASYLLHIGGYPMTATPDDCKKWNNTYIMEATAFLAGLLFHVSCEYSGVNEWYVKNYYSR